MPIDPIALLARLIEAKSYSGQEKAAADVLEDALRGCGAAVRRVGHNLFARHGARPPVLLFNSHLDTVPASPGWTRDPWKAGVEAGRLYGLGATDAKSCVAAMAAAFDRFRPAAEGSLIFSATVEEETGGGGKPNGMETILPQVGPIDAGVVGEPTALNICNGQRGMVRLVLHAHGRAGHASRPWEGVNAIQIAAEDLVSIEALAQRILAEGADPVIGKPTIQATLISGGTAANVIPDRCDVTLDIRTTRRWDNEMAIAGVSRAVRSQVEVRSRRFLPVATDPAAALVRAAQAALPAAELRPFGGVSDMFFLATLPQGPVPAILLGPGDGRQSHQPDEFVDITAVQRSVDAYLEIAGRFLGG